MRWTDRLLGLVSTMFLARLLTPEDFGVVALSTIVVGFIDILFNMGITQALIYNANADETDFSTAWTLRILQGCFTAALVLAVGSTAASYFENPSLSGILYFTSFTIFIASLQNTGIVSFQKDLEFDKDFKFILTKRLVGFVVTLTLAFIYQSYWALLIGSFSTVFAGVVLSYTMHTFRPRFTLENWSSLWSYSKWVIVRNMGSYADASGDRVLIGKSLPESALGGYTVSAEVAALPSTELLAPLGRVLFPTFVAAKESVDFASKFYLALGIQTLVALPASIGLYLLSEEAVGIVLGSQWLFCIPIIQTLVLANLIVSISHTSVYVLFALGKVKLQSIIVWLQATIYISLAISFSDTFSLVNFAELRLAVVMIGSALFIVTVFYSIPNLSPRNFLSCISRPAIATCAMYLLVDTLNFEALTSGLAITTLLKVFLGIFSYGVTIFALWYFAGFPQGAESYLIDHTRDLLKKTLRASD